jgi:hypothetical protein
MFALWERDGGTALTTVFSQQLSRFVCLTHLPSKSPESSCSPKPVPKTCPQESGYRWVRRGGLAGSREQLPRSLDADRELAPRVRCGQRGEGVWRLRELVRRLDRHAQRAVGE